MFVAYQAFIRISLDVQNISASNLGGNPAYVSDIQRTYLMWFDIIYFPKTIILTNVPIDQCVYCLLCLLPIAYFLSPIVCQIYKGFSQCGLILFISLELSY